MSNDSNNIEPTLRFPEFRGNHTWKQRLLLEVLFEHGKRSTGSEEVFSVSVHKGVINQIEHLGRRFAALNTDNYKLVFPNDIIYTKSPTGDFPYGIIKQSKVSMSVIVSPLYGVFQPETEALGYILDSYFESAANTNNYLSSLIQKGAKNTINISNDRFLSKALILPTDKTEQRKIAACLSSLDELITVESQKLDALKAHKKGLMQQLFPAAGETVPKLRFEEFRENGEWEEKTLKSMCISIASGKDKNEEDGEFDLFGSTGIIGTTNNASYNGNFILVARVGANAGLLTRANGKFGVTDNTLVVSLKEQENIVFVYYVLDRTGLNKMVFGSGQPLITGGQLKNLEVYCPGPKEQQKIASCLSSLDEQITQQSEKIEALKLHKKGLMQQLFPTHISTNE